MVPTLTPLCRLAVEIAPPFVIARRETGVREVIPITGGIVEGAMLSGRVLPGGADWCLTRKDGIAEVWARYTIEATDGTLVMVTNAGLARPMAEGSYRGHTVPKFEVADGPLSFLHDHLFIATLHAHADGRRVDLELFRVD